MVKVVCLKFLFFLNPAFDTCCICYRIEMEEIRREILSLSEKYSVKCVESAALEERLNAATSQLATAHNHIMQLDAR